MMVVFWIMVVILLIAMGSALVALRLQYRVLAKARQEREAWQQAQESRQRTWEVRQGKHILDTERKLADQLKEARREWRSWSAETEQSQHDWQARAEAEQELARLPHIEHLELSLNASGGHESPARWYPPMLYRANLNGRDLSYRYMGRADLRDAQLTDANLHMADLAGASLTGANLEGANLTGANLAGADLRGANLSGANFLVADLHQAILHGANFSGARNLSSLQLQTAIYDSSTIIDAPISVTLSHLPGVQRTLPERQDASDVSQESAGTVASPVSSELIASNSVMPALPNTPTPDALDAEPFIKAELLSLSSEREKLNSQPLASVPTTAPRPTHVPEMSSIPRTVPEIVSGTTSSTRQKSGEKKSASTERKKRGNHKIIQLSTRVTQTMPTPTGVTQKSAQRKHM
jgi:type II secretory pathway pseudopilin PulG